MRMTFFWTPDLGEFFFENLKIESVKALTILCGVLAVFSLLYEGIKVKYYGKNMRVYKIITVIIITFYLGLLSKLSS